MRFFHTDLDKEPAAHALYLLKKAIADLEGYASESYDIDNFFLRLKEHLAKFNFGFDKDGSY